MLGKSVLPRVLVRVTLLLPAHLPVLIGLRVSTVSVCVSVSVTVKGEASPLTVTLTLTQTLTVETLRPISTGKCAGKSSVTRTSTRGNTLLPSTLTLLIGLRVTHSWGCVSVCVGVCRARATHIKPILPEPRVHE